MGLNLSHCVFLTQCFLAPQGLKGGSAVENIVAAHTLDEACGCLQFCEPPPP